MEFFVDAADVGVHRRQADADFFGDFLVEEALREEVEDFGLAGREIFAFGHRRRGRSGGRWGALDRLLEGLDDFAGDVGGHWGTARVELTERLEKLSAFGVLEHVTGRPSGKRFEDVVGVFVHCEHDELCVRHEWFEAAHTFDSAEAWGQVNVADHDSRLLRREGLKG